jgi:uncharacterized protein YegP (UPF0339 family)
MVTTVFPAGSTERAMQPMVEFQIRRASGIQPYYCRAVSSGNHTTLMTSETYRNKTDAIHVARLVGGPNAKIVDYT